MCTAGAVCMYSGDGCIQQELRVYVQQALCVYSRHWVFTAGPVGVYSRCWVCTTGTVCVFSRWGFHEASFLLSSAMDSGMRSGLGTCSPGLTFSQCPPMLSFLSPSSPDLCCLPSLPVVLWPLRFQHGSMETSGIRLSTRPTFSKIHSSFALIPINALFNLEVNGQQQTSYTPKKDMLIRRSAPKL